jgi:hypothetical protein
MSVLACHTLLAQVAELWKEWHATYHVPLVKTHQVAIGNAGERGVQATVIILKRSLIDHYLWRMSQARTTSLRPDMLVRQSHFLRRRRNITPPELGQLKS